MEPHSDRLYFKSETSTDGRARGWESTHFLWLHLQTPFLHCCVGPHLWKHLPQEASSRWRK